VAPETELLLYCFAMVSLGDNLHQQPKTYDSMAKHGFPLFPVHQISLRILDLP
jgi:hypothetical protein